MSTEIQSPALPVSESQCLAAIYHHDDCFGHHIASHPEKPSRVSSILDSLRHVYSHTHAQFFRLAPLVTQQQLLLFHSLTHVTHFNKLCQRAEASGKKMIIDDDTEVMTLTRLAVYRAAGALIAAVDALFLPEDHPQRIQSAFCCTRPPGHHAERDRSMGFCFFNNAAIAAKYAQTTYGEQFGLRRVAVLDFDVHHGNGTEEGFNDDKTLFYGSTHELGNFPGTGPEPHDLYSDPHSVTNLLQECSSRHSSSTDINMMVMCRMWRLLYLGTKEGLSMEKGNQDFEGEVPSAAISSVNQLHSVSRSLRSRRIVDRELRPGRMSRRDFRKGWVDIVLEMIRFQPHLVIISAGFDAHHQDPLANCQLTEEDFGWATALVKEACRFCPETKVLPKGIQGCPVLSILEGGYNEGAIARSATIHVQELFRDIATPPPLLPDPPSTNVEKISECPMPPLYPSNFVDNYSNSSGSSDDNDNACESLVGLVEDSTDEKFSDMMASLFLNEMNITEDNLGAEPLTISDSEEGGCEKMSISDILSRLDDSIASLMVAAVTEENELHEESIDHEPKSLLDSSLCTVTSGDENSGQDDGGGVSCPESSTEH